MSDWVERFSQQLSDDEARRNHISKTLPDKADDFWRSLTSVIGADIQKLNDKFQHKIGRIDLQVKGLLVLHIQKLDFPAYYLDVILNESRTSIRVEGEYVPSASSSKRAHKIKSLPLSLSLDRNDNLIVKGEYMDRLTTNDLSEIILKPIVLGSEPADFFSHILKK